MRNLERASDPVERIEKSPFFPPLLSAKTHSSPYREWIEDARLQAPPIKKSLTSVTYKVLFKNLVRHPVLILRFLLARMGWSINT